MVQLVHAGQFDLVPKISNLGTGISQGMEMANQFQAGKQKRLEDTQEQSFLRADLVYKMASEMEGMEPDQAEAYFNSMSDEIAGAGIDISSLGPLNFDKESIADVKRKVRPLLRSSDADLSAGQREWKDLTKDLSEEDKKKAARIKLRLDAGAMGSSLQTIAGNPEMVALVAAYEKLLAEKKAGGKVVGTVEAEADTVGTAANTSAAMIASDAAAKQAAIDKQTRETQERKLPQVATIYKNFKDADLSKIYGKGEGVYPELLRSQEGIDLIADRDKVISMLQLGARGELKGQGNITDGETEMLSKAATILGNPNISPTRARAALDEAFGILYRSAGRDFTPEQGGGNSAIDIDSLIQQAEQL